MRLALLYVLFGGLWIILSDRILSTFITSTELLTDLQTLKGWIFVLTTAAIIFWMFRSAPAAPASAFSSRKPPRRLPVFLIGALLLIVLGIALAGGVYYHYQKENFRIAKERELTAIVQLKAGEVLEWRKHCLEEAESIQRNKFVISALEDYLPNPRGEKRSRIIDWLGVIQRAYAFEKIVLLDAGRNPRFSVGTGGDLLIPEITPLLDSATASGRTIFSRLREDVPRNISIDLIVPLSSTGPGKRSVFATIILRTNPFRRLFSLIRSWPSSMRTSECMLYSPPDSGRITILNDLRLRRNASLVLTMENADAEGTQGIWTREGIVETRDYRGVPVLAAVRLLEDTGWYMAAKVDIGEIFAPVYARGWAVIAFIGIFVLTAAAGTSAVWRHQVALFYRRQYEQEVEQRALIEHFDYLTRHAHDIILLTDAEGRIIEFNDRPLAVYQYSREEFLRLTYRQLCLPGDRSEEKISLAAGGEGTLFETQHVRKNGTTLAVEVGLQIITIDDQRFRQYIIRDITERKRAELQIRESERRLSEMLQNIRLLAIMLDREGNIIFANSFFLDTTGWSGESVTGRNWFDLCLPEGEAARIKIRYRERIEEGTIRHQTESEILTRAGERRVISWTNTYLRNLLGEVIGMTSLGEDVTERKRVVRELRNSEEKYRLLFNSNPQPMWVYDIETLRIVAVNDAAVSHYGYSQEEFLSMTVADIRPPEDVPLLLDTLAASIDGLDRAGIWRHRRKDGSIIRVEITTHTILFENRRAKIVLAHDVTDKLAAQEALIRAEERYRGIFENAVEGLYQSTPDGRFVMVNPAFAHMLGYDSPADLMTRVTNIGEQLYLHPEQRMELVRRMERENVAQAVEVQLYRSDGRPIWLSENIRAVRDDAGALILFEGSVENIDEQKRAEESVRKLILAVEQTDEVIFLTTLDGTITYVNPAFEKVYGYAREEAVGRTPRILKSSQQPQESYKEFWDAISSGASTRSEIINRRKDGRYIIVESSVNPVHDAKGEMIGFVAVQEDITERKRAEEELVRAKERAEESDRLKDAFIANISHEIRTPLNVIMGYAGLIETEFAGRILPEEKGYFDSIGRGGRQLMRTVEHILNISSMQAGIFRLKPELLDLGRLVPDIVSDMRSLAVDKGLALEFRSGVPPAPIRADRYCIEQAVTNLIDNAIKFTRRGSVSVELGAENGFVTIRVQDTGVGISAEYLPKVFREFSQETSGYTRPYEGLGLGLALTQKYIELNNGSIAVESSKNAGTTFTIRINPADEEIPPEAAPSEQMAPAPSLEQPARAVLVVEDDEQSQNYMRIILSKSFVVHLAATAGEARRILAEQPVDLILMDLSLRGPTDGIMLTREIRSDPRRASLPIIALTAHAFPRDQQRSLDAGCNAYMAKPFRLEQLMNLIHRYLPE